MSFGRVTDGMWHVGGWRMEELVENDRIASLGGRF
jgi:hypothetical protein